MASFYADDNNPSDYGIRNFISWNVTNFVCSDRSVYFLARVACKIRRKK